MAAFMSVVVNVSRSSVMAPHEAAARGRNRAAAAPGCGGRHVAQALHGRVVRRAVRHRGSRHSLCVLGEGPGPTLRVAWPLREKSL